MFLHLLRFLHVNKQIYSKNVVNMVCVEMLSSKLHILADKKNLRTYKYSLKLLSFLIIFFPSSAKLNMVDFLVTSLKISIM